jgi:hypothetical protein
MHTDTYLGTGELIPELCIYEQGEAPQQGEYTIAEADGTFLILISWTDAQNDKHSIEFSGAPDGSNYPTEAPGLTHMTLTRVSPGILDSAAYNEEVQMIYARRIAHDNLLSIWQRINTDNGSISIFQVYRRAAA